MTDHDARMQEIETRIAFQEHLLEHLNEALTSQQKQLDALTRQIARIASHLESPQGIRRPEDETPPPHY